MRSQPGARCRTHPEVLQGHVGKHSNEGRFFWGVGQTPSGGAVPLYLETVISVGGPCAFSRPSLVKMPTSTMTATTPQMM